MDLTSIELLRKGKPYSFTDGGISRQWTINPFAFRLKSTDEGGKGEAGIVIDWEHDGWEWHDPLEINDSDEFGGVPKLVNSLRRVWPEYDLGPEAGAALTKGLVTLQDDHESGARQLAAKAVSVLRQVIAELDSADVDGDTWWANVRMTAWHLCNNGRESMGAAITSAVISVLDKLEAAHKSVPGSAERTQQALSAIDEFLSQRNTAVERIRNSLVDYLRTGNSNKANPRELSVLTTSYSSTVSDALLEAAAMLNVVLDLRILESRPLCEGVTLASKLLEQSNQSKKVNVTIYSDASAAIAAKDVDIVLFGADRISSTGDVSNKTGTLPAVLSARHISPHARVVVLSEIEKIAGPGAVGEHPVEENNPAELSSSWEHGVKGNDLLKEYMVKTNHGTAQSSVAVKNVYFEWVPAKFIAAYITDEGIWSAKEIKKRSDEIESETKRFFEDL